METNWNARIEQRVVNGSLMKKYVDKTVRLWLNVGENNTAAGGRKLEGTTTDKKTITVLLETPLNQAISGWVEIIGTSTTGGTQITCDEIIVFPSNDDNSEPFDEEAHNAMLFTIDNMLDFNETGN